MQHSISQVAALVVHGNAFLRGDDVPGFWPGNSTYRFCETVSFVTFSALGPHAYAPDPLRWFEQLRADGVLGLRLRYGASPLSRISDRMSVALMGGGGSWIVETVKHGSLDEWRSEWKLGDRDHPQKKIWHVTYGRTREDGPLVAPRPGQSSVRGELTSTLAAVSQFAWRKELDAFARLFDQALQALQSDDPLAGQFHSDLAPAAALGLPSRQLLGAASAAWVFGGMGSWNDLGFEGVDGRTYEALSERLFAAIVRAIVEGANGSFAVDVPAPVSRPWWKLW